MKRGESWLLILGGLGVVWWWLTRGGGGPGGPAGAPALAVGGNLGNQIRNEDSSGDAAAALFAYLLGGGSAGGARVQLNTPKLNLNVDNPAGAFATLVADHCATDPGDGFCRKPGTRNLLTRYLQP